MTRAQQIEERQRRVAAPLAARATKPARPEDREGAGGPRWGVLREVDVEAGTMKAQYLRNASNPPVAGEDRAYGQTFSAYPQPGATVAQYNVPGVLVPLIGDLALETLGTNFMPVLIHPDLRVQMILTMPAGVEVLTLGGQGSEGSGV